MITNTHAPTLKAIILDFSSVNNVDITSVQHLIDVRNQLDKYASPDKVDWHFAHVNNRWTKRALASAGFGYPTPPSPKDGKQPQPWKPIFSVAEIGGKDSAAAYERKKSYDIEQAAKNEKDNITHVDNDVSSSGSDIGKTLDNSKAYRHGGKIAVVQGLNRPLFHVDLTSALQSAVANVESRESEQAHKKGVGTGDVL